MLSHDEEEFDGNSIVPFDYVLAHIPPAPKYYDEIKAIIDEGLVSDTGCMTVEAYGTKDGKNMRIEVHVMAPGLVESFERSGISAEMYITGQGGSIFTKLFANDKYDQTGLITSDMLTGEELDYYFDAAAKLAITLEIRKYEV